MKNELLWLRMLLQEKLKEKKLRNIFERKEEQREEKNKMRKGQLTLVDFEDEKIKIYVDHREFRSEVVKILSQQFVLVPHALSVGDYLISERMIVERKTANDFLESIKDGRLFSQMMEMRKNYQVPILIIEGELFTGGFHENSIYGALASIIGDYRISVIFTRDAQETAKLIEFLVKREYSPKEEIAIRKEKRAMSDEERQRYIVESLPNVSAKLSHRLLEHFGSVRNVINAEVGELMQVKGIGRKIAEDIYEVVNKKYAVKRGGE